MLLIFSVQPPKKLNSLLEDSLHYILQVCRDHQKQQEVVSQSQPPSLKRSNSDQGQRRKEDDKEQGTCLFIDVQWHILGGGGEGFNNLNCLSLKLVLDFIQNLWFM